MCKRSTNDPLVRVLTDKYRLNILRVPRAGIDVGDLLVADSGDLQRMGAFARFFDPHLELPKSSTGQLAPVSGEISQAISAKLAATPMVAFLTALGLTGLTKLSAKLRGEHKLAVTFKVTGATMESIDVVDLSNSLIGKKLNHDSALYREGREFFIAHAVARATGLTLGFEGEGGIGAEIAAGIAQVAEASADVETHSTSAGEINVVQATGSPPLVFGLAVLQVTEDSGKPKLDLPEMLHTVRSQASASKGTPKEVPSVLLGGAEAELLLDIEEQPTSSRRPDQG